MTLDEYVAMDAVAIAAAVREGELSAAEVTDAALAAIAALNPALNAVILLDADRAREAARHVSCTLPLAGVPFLLKDVDVYSVEWPTTHSSRFFADARPRADSEIVRRWRAAGAVFLGKSNTPEFADDFATEPAYRGITRNPWQPGLTVGGSSGGAAAAVASGMVPAAHGSDVGGSIRVPAACCGLFGLKPSRGLNPGGPYFGHAGGGLNTGHVLSRSVRDSAAYLDATAGVEPGSGFGVVRPVASYLDSLHDPTGPLDIVCLPVRIDGSDVAPEVAAGVATAVARLRDLGHRVTMADYPTEVALATSGESWSLLWMMDIVCAIDARAAELGRPPLETELEPLARWIWSHGRAASARDYLEAQRAAHQATLAMARAFGHADLLVAPTTATLPPPVGTFGAADAPFDPARWAAAAYGFAPFTELYNVTGQPAASVPVHVSPEGLPVGVQLVARHGRDDLVLRVAAALEAATGWIHCHPPCWPGNAVS
ncbi:MAG: amidase [Proteobacteria bacterium]|nr:amidase [Pseudomonadota bacterium]